MVVTILQGQVQLSGVVQEKSSNRPVAGAHVSLARVNLTTVTADDGTFTLSGTALRHPPERGKSTQIPFSAPQTPIFSQEKTGPVVVRFFNSSGQLLNSITTGKITPGMWRITPPQLHPGMYVCTITSPTQQHTTRFLVTSFDTRGGHPNARIAPCGSSVASLETSTLQAKVAAPVDTLLVQKNGYALARYPLTSLVNSNIVIFLEDTSSVNLDNTTIIPDPSWTCFMPGGIPPPALGAKVFTIKMNYRAIHKVGITKFGERRQFDISGGTVSGSKLTATLVSGGLDYELKLSNGNYELEQIIILKAGSTPILMRNAGVAPAGAKTVRMVLDFEAPNSSSYTWLHTGKFVAERMVDSTEKTITLDVFDVAGVTLPSQKITLTDPAGVENQTWDCLKMTGGQGASVFTENVTLGASVSIGQTKNGSRNIIPITGGTTTGKVAGQILDGGADYQMGGLDARYTLAPSDGEFIIVRNCGSGTLYPVFEARVDGPYNYLNKNNYVSSPPGVGAGGVSITFYERK